MSPSRPSSAISTSPPPGWSGWRAATSWTLIAVSLATFMTYLDNNIVNVAIPAIQRDLHLTTAGLEWVASGYILVFDRRVPGDVHDLPRQQHRQCRHPGHPARSPPHHRRVGVGGERLHPGL